MPWVRQAKKAKKAKKARRNKLDAFIRKAEVLRVIDGDTIYLDVDLGLHTHQFTKLRLDGRRGSKRYLDTPEIKGPEKERGLFWKSYVEERLPVGSTVWIQTRQIKSRSKFHDKQGRYGRFIAEVWYGSILNPKSLNEELLNALEAEKVDLALEAEKKALDKAKQE